MSGHAVVDPQQKDRVVFRPPDVPDLRCRLIAAKSARKNQRFRRFWVGGSHDGREGHEETEGGANSRPHSGVDVSSAVRFVNLQH
jgi:hypothetical protein